MDRRICRSAYRVIRALLLSFKTLILLGIKLLAKAIRNVTIGLDNPSLLYIIDETFRWFDRSL